MWFLGLLVLVFAIGFGIGLVVGGRLAAVAGVLAAVVLVLVKWDDEPLNDGLGIYLLAVPLVLWLLGGSLGGAIRKRVA